MSLKDDTKTAEIIMNDCFNKIEIDNADDINVMNKLEEQNTSYCGLIDSIKRDYGISKDIGRNHYVAMTIGGHINSKGCLGSSHKVIEESKDYNKKLVTELETTLCAKLGGKSPYDTNLIVGKCAEVRVADNLLRYNVQISDFKEIKFTAATRPRTQEKFKSGGDISDYYRPRCANCSAFFGKELNKLV